MSAKASQLLITGDYTDCTIDFMLRSIAWANDLDVTVLDGCYYIGSLDRNDVYSYVLPLGLIDAKDAEKTIRPILSKSGSVAVSGNSIVITDTIERVRVVAGMRETLNANLNRSYIAEVYFLRVKDSDFIQLSADLEINQVDIFGDSWNIEELFKCCLNGDLGKSGNSVDQRPVIYLSEGRESKFNVGSEIIKEKYNYSEGVSTINGYEKFQDGLTLTLLPQKLDSETVKLDFDLTISTFDESDKSDIPKSDKSTLTTRGLICKDGRVHYVGSLKKYGQNRKFGLLSLDNSQSSDVLTIWLRIREVG